MIYVWCNTLLLFDTNHSYRVIQCHGGAMVHALFMSFHVYVPSGPICAVSH